MQRQCVLQPVLIIRLCEKCQAELKLANPKEYDSNAIKGKMYDHVCPECGHESKEEAIFPYLRYDRVNERVLPDRDSEAVKILGILKGQKFHKYREQGMIVTEAYLKVKSES